MVSAPASPIRCKPVDQRVAPLAVILADGLGLFRQFVQRHRAGDLDWLKNPVVQIALDLAQRPHQFRIAQGKAPTRQPGMLKLFDSEKNSMPTSMAPGALQQAGRLIAVEDEIGVSEVVHNDEPHAAGEVHHLGEKVEINARRRRIVRKVEHQDFRTRLAAFTGRFQTLQQVRRGGKGYGQDVAVGKNGAVHVDGVGRGRHQHRVAGIDDGPHEVREAFLDADGCHHVVVAIDVNTEPPAVVICDGQAELADARGRPSSGGYGVFGPPRRACR